MAKSFLPPLPFFFNHLSWHFTHLPISNHIYHLSNHHLPCRARHTTRYSATPCTLPQMFPQHSIPFSKPHPKIFSIVPERSRNPCFYWINFWDWQIRLRVILRGCEFIVLVAKQCTLYVAFSHAGKHQLHLLPKRVSLFLSKLTGIFKTFYIVQTFLRPQHV